MMTNLEKPAFELLETTSDYRNCPQCSAAKERLLSRFVGLQTIH